MRGVLTKILLIFSALCINAQVYNDITKPSLSRISLAEKIYLQLDNILYQTGETIWYKAIVAKSYDNSLSDLSQILHVELINADNDIIQSQLLKLSTGISNGSFVLEKSYKPGKYRIRAYTNWNRNFEDDFMFSQSIEVINLKEETQNQKPIINIVVGTGDYTSIQADINPKIINQGHKGRLSVFLDTGASIDTLVLEPNKKGVYKLEHILPANTTKAELKLKIKSKNKYIDTGEDYYSETIIVDEDYVDLQFFPEGGKLVSGLLSTVGFKALDYNGLGYKLDGVIKDHKNEQVTSFKSNDLGMGTFKLKPQKGSSYYAEIKINDATYKYSLPNAYFKGSVLTVADFQDELRLSVSSKNQLSDYLTVQVSSRGIKYQSFKFEQKNSITTEIPKQSIPDGIIKITVRNDNDQILCERLVFNDRDNQRLPLGLSSDKINYSQREKVRVQISLDSAFANSDTSISALVVNKERQETSKKYRPNIMAYLFLNSELKGFIERPDYYFETLDKSRKMDLDALMLTQGWRDYKYQKEQPVTTFVHQPKSQLEISGTIGEYFNPNKRPKKPLDLNLIVMGEQTQAHSLEIPNSGQYYFQIEDVYKDDTEFFMQVVDKKGTPIDFKINHDKTWLPAVKKQNSLSYLLPSRVKKNFSKQMEAVNEIQKAYETTFKTIALEEVNIKGYDMTPAREEFIALHGEPDIVIDGKDINEKAPEWNYGLLSVLKSKYKDKVDIILVGPPNGRKWLEARVKNHWTIILIDNIPVVKKDYSLLQDIPAEEIESIDILLKPKDAKRYHNIVWPYEKAPNVIIDPSSAMKISPRPIAFINIYTNAKKGFFGLTKAEGFLIDSIKGFTESVEFYAPNYETLSNQDWLIPDNRSVIHWEPNITLNDEGKYYLEFYNDDHVGEVSVIVEAISKDGKIGYVEKTYTVKEAER